MGVHRSAFTHLGEPVYDHAVARFQSSLDYGHPSDSGPDLDHLEMGLVGSINGDDLVAALKLGQGPFRHNQGAFDGADGGPHPRILPWPE